MVVVGLFALAFFLFVALVRLVTILILIVIIIAIIILICKGTFNGVDCGWRNMHLLIGSYLEGLVGGAMSRIRTRGVCR